jgi:hypothetical protein
MPSRRRHTSLRTLAIALLFFPALLLAGTRQASAELMDFTGTLTTTLIGELSVSTPISGQVNVVGEMGNASLVISFAPGVITQMSSGTFGAVNLQNKSGELYFRTPPSSFRERTLSTNTTVFNYPVSMSYRAGLARVSDQFPGFGGPIPLTGTIQVATQVLSPVSVGASIYSSPYSSALLTWGTGTVMAYEGVEVLRYSYYTIPIPTTTPYSDPSPEYIKGPPSTTSYPMASTTVTGSAPLESAGRITVSLVAPMAFKRSIPSESGFFLIGVARMDLEIVPEPGPSLLMGASLAMLIGLRACRRKK